MERWRRGEGERKEEQGKALKGREESQLRSRREELSAEVQTWGGMMGWAQGGKGKWKVDQIKWIFPGECE
jgi:hypothetical protein